LRRGPLVAALCVGTLIPIAPVTARNWNHGRELVLVSTNGGLNFYLGNNPDSAATLALRPGPRWDALALEPRRHGVRGAGAASTYFLRKGLAFYRHQPGQALALLGRKLYLFCNGAEIPRDTDILAAREGSRVLAVLVRPPPVPLPNGLLIPLGLLGAALWFGDRRRLAVPYLFLAVQMLVIAAFFVTSRHRAPALPLFALFAVAGGAVLWQRLRAGPLRTRFGLLAVLAALLVVCNLPTREAAVSYAGERDFYRGLAYRGRGEPGAATAAFRRAVAREPTDARAWLELGDALAASGRSGEALEPWRRAAALDPADGRAARRLAAALAAVPASSSASQPSPESKY
jgi:tetratricopeptide (TPR) repeat protein